MEKVCGGLECHQYGDSSKKTQHTWHRLIDRKINFLDVKFEVGPCISFRRTLVFNKWEGWSAKVAAHGISNSAFSTIDSLCSPILFFASFFTFYFSIDIGTTSRTIHPLYNDLKRQRQGRSLILTILSIFVLPWLTFAFCEKRGETPPPQFFFGTLTFPLWILWPLHC
jgi:hypothetical protein